MKKKLATIGFGVVAITVLFYGWSRWHPSAISANDVERSHRQMLSLLSSIRDSTPTEDPFLGDSEVKTALSNLAQLDDSSPVSDQLQYNWQVANHMLRLGKNLEATQYFQATHRLAQQAPAAVTDEQSEMILLMTALAFFRIAETENCIAHHSADSCLFPLQGGGIHIKQEHTRQTLKYLSMLLDRNAGHTTARWLLNIAYMAVGGYPDEVPSGLLIPRENFESKKSFPRFMNIAPALKVDSFNLSGGSIVDDFDNDGLLDIVSSTWDPQGQIYFFRNQGDGTFADRTAASGLTGIYGGLNLIQADYDNDGDTDFLVLRGGWTEGYGIQPNSLLQNDGKAHFRDITFAAGLGQVHYPTQTGSWADYDLDGYLDLYIGNELAPGQLFHNNGNGTFTDMARQAGLLKRSAQFNTKGVIFGDYNNDRWPDLFVSNMGALNSLYHNNQDGTFSDFAANLDMQTPIPSFAAWFWDFNNDGLLDLFVPSYQIGVQHVAADYIGLPEKAARDHLYQNMGKGQFKNRAAELNLTRTTQPMGCNFGDLDNDGFLDFYLGTGYPQYIALMPNLMFYNERGKGFSDVTTTGGFGHLQKGHGVSFADLDNDGDQDIFIQIGGWYAGDRFSNGLFENPGFGHHWIGIKLIGKQSNRSAIGSRIQVDIREEGKPRSIYKWVNSGGSFGANPLRQQIGLGTATRIEKLTIYWPKTDSTQTFENLDVDQFIEIGEGDSRIRPLDLPEIHFRIDHDQSHQHPH
ncbi:MAG: CRTAC1 family protein [Pirellulaceae bacterium]